MNDHAILNILDYMNVIGEDGLRAALSGFSCPKNQEIEIKLAYLIQKAETKYRRNRRNKGLSAH